MYDFQELFYQVMTRLKANSRSRGASTSTPPKDEARVTEIINGLLVSKPAKKEPEIIDLQEYTKSSKAASIPSQGINKVRAIHDFIQSNGSI